jgi:hypothetical protein
MLVDIFRDFQLNALEEGLEVSGAEALMVVALDDLDEDGRPVLERLREDLDATRADGA